MRTGREDQLSSSSKVRQYLGIANLAVPLFFFALIAIRTSINIPFEDDYTAAGEFLERYISLHSPFARLWWVLNAQHVQYKVMVMQAVVACQYQMTHHLNYRILEFCGDVSLPATALVLWSILRRSGRPFAQRVWLFSVPAYLYLSLCYAELVNWALTSLVGSVVIFFAVLCIFFATSTRRGSSLYCLLALALAIASCINGFLVEPVVLFLFLPARRFREAFWSVAVTLTMGALYAYHYALYQFGPHISLWTALKALVQFPLAYLGGAAGSLRMADLIGFLLLVGFIFLTRKGWLRVCPASFGAALFCLLTDCLVTSGRYRYGALSGITGHYRMYSVLSASLEYIAVIRLFVPQTIRRDSAWFVRLVAAGVASAVFCFAWDIAGYRLLRDRQEVLTTHLILWERQPDELVLIPNKQIDETYQWRFQKDLQREIAMGLYVPPYRATDPLPRMPD